MKILICPFKILSIWAMLLLFQSHLLSLFYSHLLLLTYSSPKYLLYITWALFAHHFSILKALFHCFLLFTPTPFLYSPVQSKLALPSFCWQLACMVNSNLLEILIFDFLNHLFDTYIVPSGIPHFVMCTHI